MTLFQPNDRVRVYGTVYCDGRLGDFDEGISGTVIEREKEISRGKCIYVRSDNNHDLLVHPKQCRRLIKKKAEYFWANEYSFPPLGVPHKFEAEADATVGRDRIAKLKLKVVKRIKI